MQRSSDSANVTAQLNASRATEREYFDSLVKQRGQFNPFTEAGWAVLRSAFDRIIDDGRSPQNFSEVLDVGCGTGQSFQLYARRTAHYIGVDLSSAAVAAARVEFPEQKWITADATRLPFDDQSFNLVAFSSVLHHIPDYLTALQEAFRVLRPGGRVFAYDPSLLHPGMALFRWPRSPFYSDKGVSPNESPMLPGTLRRQFVAAGFEEVRQFRQPGLTLRAIEPLLLRPFLPIYNTIDRLLASVGLWRWFGAFLLTSGKKPPMKKSNT